MAIVCLQLPLNLFSETPAPQLHPDATLSLTTFTNEPTSTNPPDLSLPAVTLPETAPRSGSVPKPLETLAKPLSNAVPANLTGLFADTNNVPLDEMSEQERLVNLKQKLEMARYLRASRQSAKAEPLLIDLLVAKAPESIQQSALLELAAAAQDENELPRAQQIYAQFLGKWSSDLRVPEILLRQGLLFRQMGMNNMALTKFYGVMTSALVLKSDRLDYYAHVVQQAQIEIAETHYELGKYPEAADFFSRLLKQTNAVNKSQILYKLARCHSALGRYAEAVADAQDFLVHYPDASEQPEIRFYLAVSLKELGRDNESLQQVLLLLQEQRERTKDRPAVWAYWQQRAGNLIANHLYREGDYTKALDVYLHLARLDDSLSWKLPVNYQIGMTYERLWQAQKATETYAEILSHEAELGTNVPPSLRTVFEMSRWRTQFIQWQEKAEAANREIHLSTPTNTPVAANLPASPDTNP